MIQMTILMLILDSQSNSSKSRMDFRQFFFNQQRYLINTVDVDFELTRNDPKFCLSAVTDTRERRILDRFVHQYTLKNFQIQTCYVSVYSNKNGYSGHISGKHVLHQWVPICLDTTKVCEYWFGDKRSI
jgi:hypothetical protein